MEELKRPEPQEGAGKEKKKRRLKKGVLPKLIILVFLSISLLVSGYYYYRLVKRNTRPRVIATEEKIEVREERRERIAIQVPDRDGEGLVSMDVEIEATGDETERLRRVFDILKSEMDYQITYADTEGNPVEVPFMDENIEVLDIFIDGGDLYLNMNYAFKENMKTISQEIFIIYSIVNTFTEGDRYKRVKFLIENREGYSLNFYSIADFYERNTEI